MRSTTARGYGSQHQKLRARWAPFVAAGQVDCGRCGAPITSGQDWHLGHDDHDRTKYTGPEHAECNLSAAGQAGRAAQLDPPPRPATRW